MTTCPACGAGMVCLKESIFSMKAEYDVALEKTGMMGARSLPEVKGVQGMISRERCVEPLEKGILRAKHNVFVFRGEVCVR